jgi:peptidoglycan/LPS O-acetylase OafA/YrhL
MTSAQPAPALPSLSSLRFLAALAVFAVHGALEVVFNNQRLGGVYLFGVMPAGHFAVTYFFLLSGFVMTWSHRAHDTPRRFWRRRAARVYPSHAVVWAAAVGLALWAGTFPTVPQALAQLFLVQSWVPDPAYYDTLNSLTWSLSVEMFCYLCFPLLLLGVLRISTRWLWPAAGAVVGLILLVPVVADTLLPETDPHPLGDVSLLWFLDALADPTGAGDAPGFASTDQVWFVYFFPPVRALEFVTGMLVARIVRERRWIRMGPAAAAALSLVAVTAAVLVPYLYQLTTVSIVPMVLLLGAMATADLRGRRSILHARPLVRLGELTFTFYLVHGLVLTYGHLAFGRTETELGPEGESWSTPIGLTFLLGAFVVSLVLAWVLHTLVEKPVMARWARPRRRDSAENAPSPAAGEPSEEPSTPSGLRPTAVPAMTSASDKDGRTGTVTSSTRPGGT